MSEADGHTTARGRDGVNPLDGVDHRDEASRGHGTAASPSGGQVTNDRAGTDDENGMDDTPRKVRALSFPLHGSQLIEASAGTGKTFTIAALYLRLVLGHGGACAFGAPQGRPLDPPEILVVTFTEAATLELRDRIRARLAEAARFFRGAGDEAGTADDFLFD